MTKCDNCGGPAIYHESSGQIICRVCKHAYSVKSGEWFVTGPETDGWMALDEFQNRHKLELNFGGAK